MQAEKLKRTAVVSIADGAKLGYVEDVLFDPAALRVAALCISANGQQATIPYDQLSGVGGDAVTVGSSDVARWAHTDSSTAALRTLDDMSKLKVLDEAGTLHGTLTGIEIDPTSGKITLVEAHKGGVLGIGGSSLTVPVSRITSIGPEVMVVSSPGGAGTRDHEGSPEREPAPDAETATNQDAPR